jgi:hypothetical protein
VERNAAIQQGVILRHIRDTGLYREKHATFADYCEKDLGYTRDWAYKRIDLADTVAALSTTGIQIDSERQARAIKPVLRDHGPEVAAEVLREAADDAATFADYCERDLGYTRDWAYGGGCPSAPFTVSARSMRLWRLCLQM